MFSYLPFVRLGLVPGFSRPSRYLLTPSASREAELRDAYVDADYGGTHLIFAFRNGATQSTSVRPRDILPHLTYQLRSADRGTMGQISGADLIAEGLEIHEAPESDAQVLVLAPLPASAPERRRP